MPKSISLTCLMLGTCFACADMSAFQKHSAPAPAPSKPAAAAKPASGGTASRGSTGTVAKTAHPTGTVTSHSAGPTTGNPAGRGATTSHPAGPTTANPAGGGAAASPSARIAPAASHAVHTPDGAARGMDIHHGLNGDRRVSVERPDHSRVVAERGGRGYVQRPYMSHGREFGRRTYYYRGRAYDRFYRRFEYRGVYLDVYAPAFYYPAGFYGWVYNPWLTPVTYAWGFAANPWYGYYAGYFTPYPVYPNASMWLTDYMVSNNLADAYEARAAQARGPAPPPAGGDAALSPEVKQLISVEVQRQLALENSEAQTTAQNQDVSPLSSGVARMLTDGASHVFVAGRSLDLVDTSGRECLVSQGDVMQLTAPPPPNAASVNLTVLASKGGAECGRGQVVTVSLSDLQDMQNQMRESIDQGLAELQSKQGKGGLPAAPESAKAPAVKAPFAAEAPPPDANAAAEISRQAQEADAAEKTTAPVAPSEVSLGQTVDQVTSVLGSPKSVADLGTKKIYAYPDMKVTFTAGKVSNIQ